MRVLVLGGTLFVGRHLVRAAVGRGHRVTTFTRGRTNPRVHEDVETLHGDRDGELDALRGRDWDVVIDTCAYRPRQAAATAALLRDQVARYCLISTASVYAHFPAHGADELTPTLEPVEDGDAYGALKVGCERAVIDAFGERVLIVRPGVLCGPHDPTGRLAYWVQRIASGGEVLAPGDPEHLVQLLDARDLAGWLITALERAVSGIFNAAGPAAALTMGGLLDTCRAVSASDARFVWAADDFLRSQGVAPWTDLPFWLPASEPRPLLDSRNAYRAGLECRPLAQTIRDVLSDDASIQRADGGPPRPTPMNREREAQLLSLARL